MSDRISQDISAPDGCVYILKATMFEAFDECNTAGVTVNAIYRVFHDSTDSTKWWGIKREYDVDTDTYTTYLCYYSDVTGSMEYDEIKPNDISDSHYHIVNPVVHTYLDGSGGNVTSHDVIDINTGERLHSVDGLSVSVGNVLKLDMAETGHADCERAYFGMYKLYDKPCVSAYPIEHPLFHGRVRKKVSSGSGTSIVVEDMMASWQSKSSLINETSDTWESDQAGSIYDIFVNARILQENGNEYNRWEHRWCVNQSAVNTGNYQPRTISGASMYDLMVIMGREGIWDTITTPEGQFLWDNYYRDFFTGDPMEFGDDLPQGIYLHGDYEGRSEMLPIMNVQRIDDNSPHQRGNKATAVGPQRTRHYDSIPDSGGGAVSTIQYQEDKSDTTRVNTNLDNDLPAQSVPAMGTNKDTLATVGEIDAELNDMNDAELKHKANMDQVLKVIIADSGTWFRPLDRVRIKVSGFDATVEDTTSPDNEDLYCIQAVNTMCKSGGMPSDNTTEIIAGRVQEVTANQTTSIEATGKNRPDTLLNKERREKREDKDSDILNNY